MIAGLDSAFAPTLDQARAAAGAGVGLWGGYIATRGGVGLYHTWSRDDFAVVQQAFPARPIGYASGWDDPVAVRQLADTWGVRLCLDVEGGIRGNGPWVQGWLDASGAGLYGQCGVHPGRQAAFHILAWYPGSDPGATWYDAQCARPAGPCGWQWQGTHSEFGVSVDRGWFDDSFGGNADMTAEQAQMLNDINTRTALLYNALFYGNEGPPGNKPLVQAQATADGIARIETAIAKLPAATANLQPVLDAIAALKAELATLTLKRV